MTEPDHRRCAERLIEEAHEAAVSGEADAADRHHYLVLAGQDLYLDFKANAFKKKQAVFSAEDMLVFSLQAPEVGLGGGQSR